ncbi:MAG: hypothetical protein GX977_09065, partial [Firmicutes bacterium]|nr:hypothetical protein [Bacillota bacterium]
MFSGHLTLDACESILSPILAEADTVAEVMLDEDSLSLLTGLISDLFDKYPEEALHLLRHTYPACLVVFLVWKA